MLKAATARAAIGLLGATVLAPGLRAAESSDTTPRSPAVRTEMLVSTSWLQQHLTDRDLVVLYVGQHRTRFDEGHIPGSRFLGFDQLVEQKKDSLNELPPVADLAALFAALGVGDRSRVILLGDRGGLYAARAYFTLDYLGHGDRTALLDGGLEKWAAEGRPLSRDQVHPVPEVLTPHLQPDILVSTSEMSELSQSSVGSGRSSYALLDARPVDEFHGAVKSKGVAKAGHISGAQSLFWKKLIHSDADPELLAPPELEQLFAGAKIHPGQKVITYCRTGMQSSFAYFVAKYLGYETAMYDGSVYEWVNRGNSLVLSPEQGNASSANR